MKDRDPRLVRLEGLLNDERARSAWLEGELASEREKTELWRRRAHRSRRRSWLLNWRRLIPSKGDPPAVEPSSSDIAKSEVAQIQTPSYPAIRALVDVAGRQLLEGLFDCVDIDAGGTRGLADGDVVAVGSSWFDRETDLIRALSGWESRVPLLVVDDGSVPGLAKSVLDRNRDLVLSSDPALWTGVNVIDIPTIVSRIEFSGTYRDTVSVREVGADLAVGSSVVGEPTWIVAGPEADMHSVANSAAQGVPAFRTDDLSMIDLEGELFDKDKYRRALVLTRRWLHDSFSPVRLLDQLRRFTSLDFPDVEVGMGVALISNRPRFIEGALENLAGQVVRPEEICIGLHGVGDPGSVKSDLERRGLTGRVLSMPSEWPLGKCMNVAVDQLDTPVVAKIDDDDYYGPGYLADASLTLRHKKADVLGKATHYVHVSGPDTTYLMGGDNEDQVVTYIPGPSLIFTRHIWEQVPFAHRFSRVDSTFVRGVNVVSGLIWSTTRDELTVRRGHASHTSTVGLDRYAARGHVSWDGYKPELCVAGHGSLSREGLLRLEPGKGRERR